MTPEQEAALAHFVRAFDGSAHVASTEYHSIPNDELREVRDIVVAMREGMGVRLQHIEKNVDEIKSRLEEGSDNFRVHGERLTILEQRQKIIWAAMGLGGSGAFIGVASTALHFLGG